MRRLLLTLVVAGSMGSECAGSVRSSGRGLQDDSVIELACQASEDTPRWDLGGGRFEPRGPRELKVRVVLGTKTVELLNDDGRVMHRDTQAVITDRTIKWGKGYAGLALERYVSNFDGTIDREAGTLRTDWDDARMGQYRMRGFKGRCRRATKLF